VREDSAISPRLAGESDLEVYYVDKNNHVNELATNGDAWVNTVIPDTVVIVVVVGLGGGRQAIIVPGSTCRGLSI
jgi:hypothetical protein